MTRRTVLTRTRCLLWPQVRVAEMCDGKVGRQRAPWLRRALAMLGHGPRTLAALIILLVLCCYGVPATSMPRAPTQGPLSYSHGTDLVLPQPGDGAEVYGGRFNASADYTLAQLQAVRVWQDGRWVSAPDGAGAWEYASWALPLARALASLHVGLTVAAAAEFALLQVGLCLSGGLSVCLEVCLCA